MEGKTPRDKTSVTVDPELWHQFQIKIAVDKKKSTDALDEAIEGWIKGSYTVRVETNDSEESGGESSYRRHREWHELLDVILNSETKHAIDAIKKNLEMFAFSTHVAGPTSPGEIREALDALRQGRKLDKPTKGGAPSQKQPKNRAS